MSYQDQLRAIKRERQRKYIREVELPNAIKEISNSRIFHPYEWAMNILGKFFIKKLRNKRIISGIEIPGIFRIRVETSNGIFFKDIRKINEEGEYYDKVRNYISKIRKGRCDINLEQDLTYENSLCRDNKNTFREQVLINYLFKKVDIERNYYDYYEEMCINAMSVRKTDNYTKTFQMILNEYNNNKELLELSFKENAIKNLLLTKKFKIDSTKYKEKLMNNLISFNEVENIVEETNIIAFCNGCNNEYDKNFLTNIEDVGEFCHDCLEMLGFNYN